MNESESKTAIRLIQDALAEDLNEIGDITTCATSPPEQQCTAVIIAKQDGVIAGMDVAGMVFRAVDAALDFDALFVDGDRAEPGQEVAKISGTTASILVAERTALNFLGHLSGIATLTALFVQKTKGTNARIMDTRKTTPAWRLLEKYAVRCGGGLNHRMGLYDMFLIKENHIVAAGGITEAVQKCRAYMRAQGIEAKIEVEVKNIPELEQALAAQVDRIMLDNMTVEQMRECVSIADHRIPLEASGNVSLDNVGEIARTGVDFISVGSITHSFKNFDFSLLLR